MGAISLADDEIHVTRKDKESLKGRFKLVGQSLQSAIVVLH